MFFHDSNMISSNVNMYKDTTSNASPNRGCCAELHVYIKGLSIIMDGQAGGVMSNIINDIILLDTMTHSLYSVTSDNPTWATQPGLEGAEPVTQPGSFRISAPMKSPSK